MAKYGFESPYLLFFAHLLTCRSLWSCVGSHFVPIKLSKFVRQRGVSPIIIHSVSFCAFLFALLGWSPLLEQKVA